MEEQALAHETAVNLLRKKQADQVTHLSESTETLVRTKQKLEKEKSEMRSEIDDLQTNTEQLTKSKLTFERNTRSMEESSNDLRQDINLAHD